MSAYLAILEFEHPSPSVFDSVKDSDLLGRVRCVRRELTPVRTVQDWDAQGVVLGGVYGVIDVTELCRYSMGDTPDKPTKLYRIRTGAESGSWWLPAHCFEEVP